MKHSNGAGVCSLTALALFWSVSAACAKGAEGAAGEGGATDAASTASGPTSSSSGNLASSSSVSSTGPGSSSSSTSGSGGTGGTGGVSGAGGGGGTGSGGMDAGVVQASTIFMAYGGSSVIGLTDDIPKMVSFANPFQEQSYTSIGLTVTGSGTCALLIRSEPTGELRYAIWNGAWVPGFGKALTPVSPGLNIVGGPAASASTNDIHVVYQGTDDNFYYAKSTFGLWSPTAEPMTVGNVMATGPVPPTVATLASGDPIAAWVGADGDLYDEVRSNSMWSVPVAHGLAGQLASITPSLATLYSGPELLAVFKVTANDGLMFSTRTGGVWSAPAVIAGASTKDQVSIAPLAAGGAVIAYQGMDDHLYMATMSAGMNPSWSMPAVGVGGMDPVLVVPPVVATGAVGADAELYYLDMAYILNASRLLAGSWAAPQFAGAAGARLALVTGK